MTTERRDRRARNREVSRQILDDNMIDYESRDNGGHLIVYGAKNVDFWPGTGKWICRETSLHGRGVVPLIKYLAKSRREQ